jgi:hypothetical protein
LKQEVVTTHDCTTKVIGNDAETADFGVNLSYQKLIAATDLLLLSFDFCANQRVSKHDPLRV